MRKVLAAYVFTRAGARWFPHLCPVDGGCAVCRWFHDR